MDTVERRIGSCQICEGEFKLDAQARMVHHGYKRPGHGYIVGDCMAVGEPAYEQSCEVLKRYTAGLHIALASGQEHLRRLEGGEIQELHVAVRSSVRGSSAKLDEMRTYKVGDHDWDRVLENKIWEQKQLVEWLERDIKRCEARIAAWKLMPIRTIQEAEAEKRAAKDVREAAQAAKKAAKLAAKVAGYQKRLDTAVRRHTTSTIAEIFESAPSKLRDIDHSLTRAAALALLERNHVWLAFGLDLQDARSDHNRSIMSAMSWPGLRYPDTKKYPWPEGL